MYFHYSFESAFWSCRVVRTLSVTYGMSVVVTDQIIIINQKYTSGREMAGVGVGQYLRVDRKVRASFRSGWAIERGC